MKKKQIAKILLSLGIGVCTIGSVGLAAACAPDDTQPTKYTVTFDGNYTGDTDTTLEVNENGKITKPTDPTRSGYTFGGWFKEAACTNAWNFDTDTVTAATILYAKWVEVETPPATTYTVSFDVDGGSAVADITEVESGAKITAPAAPTKDGYTFGGWFKEAACTNAWNFDTDTVTAATILYAKWVEVETPPATTYTVSFDVDGGSAVADITEVESGAKITAPAAPTKDGYTFGGWFKEAACTNAWNFDTDTVTAATILYAKWVEVETPPATTYTVSFNTNGGSAVADITEVESGAKITAPAAPTNPNGTGISFGGWYKDANFETAWDFENDTVTESITLYARWVQNVTTAVDWVAAATELGNPTGNVTVPDGGGYTYQGIFYFGSGIRFEPTTSSGGYTGCINTQNVDTSYITLSGDNNSITLLGRGASGSGATINIYRMDGDTRVDVGTTGVVANSTFMAAPLVINDLPAGTYYIESMNSMRIYTLSVTQSLTLGTPTEVVADSAVAPNSEILVGGTYSASGVTAQIKYDNNTIQTKTIDSANINAEGVNSAQAGTYTVTFTYTENGQTVNGSYTVKVYAVESITLGDYLTNGATTSNLQKVYSVGDTLNTQSLTVTATAKISAADTATKEFILSSSQYAVSAVDMTEAGEKTVTITVADSLKLGETAASATYAINVVAGDLNTAVENGVLNLTVNAAEAVSLTNYKTIGDAIQAIENANIDSKVMKEITIADGEYKEKLFINVPNVHLKGSALTDTVLSNTVSNNVVIWYDALAGEGDPAGSSHGTNGSASVTISSGAKGFRAENITFKNYYNTNDLYEESRTKTSNTQAVAVYLDVEEAAFYNCKFTSYHDTLYANKGSHYYDGCWIEGRTDYIFGSDAVSYFKSCNIWSIGAGADVANGGYIVATQRSSATSAGVYVFDACTLDGDENVKDGSVALGRAWSSNMKMVIMNSTISAKFATVQHTAGGSQAQRYCTMSGNEPQPANLIEYNNTGAGALVAAVEGMEGGLTADQIAEYATTTCTLVTDAAAVAAYQLSTLFTTWDPTEKNYVTINLLSGDEGNLNLGTIKVFGGNSIAAADVAALIDDEEIPEGKLVEGYYTAADLGTAYTFGTVTYAEDVSTISIYVKWADIPAPSTDKAAYTIPVAGSPDAVRTEEVEAGGTIADNDLFTIAAGSLKFGYSCGSTYGNLQNASNATSYTNLAGETIKPDQGIRTTTDSTATAPTVGIMTITAKQNITITLYLNTVNNSYNSNRAGNTISFKSGDLELASVTSVARKNVITQTLTLTAGQTVSIDLTVVGSTTRLWLFGAEAELTVS